MHSSRDQANTAQTMLAITFGFLLLDIIFDQKKFFLCALSISIIGVFFPKLSKKVEIFWLKFADMLGAVMSRVLLAIVFFCVLLPIAVLMRAFGKFKQIRMWDRSLQTVYVTRDHTYTSDDLKKMW